MLIIPAIDLKDGRCVRLLKGEEGTETVFSEDPVAVALRWQGAGAALLHLVDLDGAFEGAPRNFDLIRAIAGAVNIPVQAGGGIRSMETVRSYFAAGVSRVILGTAAFSDTPLLEAACAEFPGRIAVGLDTKGGRIAVKGWKEVLDLDMGQVLAGLAESGVAMIIHTDVDRDGTMSGVEVATVEGFLRSCPDLPVVASGGIATMRDLEVLATLEGSGLVGVIVGRSIYTGSIDLPEAVERFS